MTHQTRVPKGCAIFQADAFPDDTVGDEEHIEVFPGRNIAEALVPILKQAGCAAIGEPLHRDEHGWEVLFCSGGKRFSVQVSRIEPETILHFDKTYLSDGLFYRGPSRLSVLLDKIQPLIGADPRFHALAWFRAGDDYPTDWQARFDEPAHAGGGENA